MTAFSGCTASNFTLMRTDNPVGWANNLTITPMPCQTGDPCPLDGTWWKITFANTPSTSGSATITVKATLNGASGYTSFTLQVDTNATQKARNPPGLATLPNYSLQLNSSEDPYTTQFAIGDLGSTDDYGDYINKEDIALIDETNFTFASNNTALIDSTGLSVEAVPPSNDPIVALQQGPHSYVLTATTKANVTGTATITVTLTDPDLNSSSTSFVLQVWPSNSDNPPSISPDSNYNGTFLVHPSPTISPPQYHYIVSSNDSDNPAEHKVSATSSNTKLIPNDTTHLSCSIPDSTGKGTVTIMPITPLPSPSPGVPQASTITLSVEDGRYVRQNSFLYIVSPAGGTRVTAYSRPTGVYPTSGVTTLANLQRDSFLNGAMVNLTWDTADVLSGATHDYDWDDIDTAISTIQLQNPTLDLSLDLERDACYTFDQAMQTWCDSQVAQDHGTCTNITYCDPPDDTQFKRAVPWDDNLRSSRRSYLGALRDHLNTTYINSIKEMDYIEVIDTNLPGIETGIREPGMSFNSTDFTGYTREKLLGAIQDELRTAQTDFPGKLIQIGFFEATDNLVCAGNPPDCYPDELWQWLYKDASATDATTGVPLYKSADGTPLLSLADEFDGVLRPRVSFFQETLASARTPIPPSSPAPTPTPSSSAPNYSALPATTAYTYTPTTTFIPSFAYYDTLTNDTYNNGIVFQANTVWSDPFMNEQGVKYTKTVNGSPNDALEGAFNTFHSEYLEMFPQDIDQAKSIPPALPSINATLWAGQLQSWHDYAASLRAQAPLEGPAGLDVTYADSTHLTVTCYPVYGATTGYSVHYRSLGTAPSPWIDAGLCDPTAVGGCTIPFSGTEYAVQVAANGPNAAWSNAAIFLSEASNDGYISRMNMNYQNVSSGSEPGILVGEPGAQHTTHDRGFLSFHTGDLGSVVVLGAKLRLKQSTSGNNLVGGLCMIDVKNGYFGSSVGLNQMNDYSTSTGTTTNAFAIPKADSTTDNWAEVNLTKSLSIRNINLTTATGGGVTQFRMRFDDGVTNNRYESWYSGNSTSYPPQLLIRYQ
jgi:hypothetical protein